MNAVEIIKGIVEAGAENKKAIIDVLEDGEVLKSFGITDKDQSEVEEAHWVVKNSDLGDHLASGGTVVIYPW